MSAFQATMLEDLVTGHYAGLTTPQIAGLIAFGIFISNVLFNLAWPLITISMLEDQESAVTWSVVSRMLHNSYWPTLLRADSSASAGVRGKVNFLSWVMIIGAVIMSLAAIITPLGLYEAIVASKTPQLTKFAYARDENSALGLGTAPRISKYFNRICGGARPVNCPHGTNTNITMTKNGTTESYHVNTYYDITIPQKYMDFWSSGLSKFNRSMSSIFDIEWRTYAVQANNRKGDTFYNNGSQYMVGSFRPMTNVILNDAWEVVEGLIIDTKGGGVGFRNHTVPVENVRFGAQWTEDILFIEPVTECANMNLTLEFDLADNSPKADKITLVDNGGFVDVNHTYPLYSPADAQNDPELAYRAYKGAWTSNVWTMLYMNITNPGPSLSGKPSFSYMNSVKGQRHPLQRLNTSNSYTYDLDVKVNAIHAGAWVPYFSRMGYGTYASNTTRNSTTPPDLYIPPNPWQLSKANFTEMRRYCQGTLNGDYANITNVAGQCGLVMGIPQRKDGSQTVLWEAGSKYEVPLYNCASASRAIIKTVTFNYNTTAGLKGLKVVNIEEKKYTDNASMPLWASENSELRLLQSVPLWGIVDKEDTSMVNVTYKRSPHFWLTGLADIGGTITVFSQNLPGNKFAVDALNAAYNTGMTPLSTSDGAEYSGSGNLPMYMRWKELTKTGLGTAKLINLIWTDVAANSVVGTKSWIRREEPQSIRMPITLPEQLKKRAAAADDLAMVPITAYNRVIKYRIQYAIPAFLALILLGSALIYTLFMFISRRASLHRLRAYLARLSTGRVMTTLLEKDGYQGLETPVTVSLKRSMTKAPSREKWVRQQGKTRIDIAGHAPRMAGSEFSQTPSRDDSDASTAMLEKKSDSPTVRSLNSRDS